MASLSNAYLNAENQHEWLARIERIEPEATPRWGSLRPAPLVAHLRRALELSLGEVPVQDQSIPVLRTLLRWFSFTLPMPWPKGKIKAPAFFFPENPAALEEEKRLLAETMERFTRALAETPERRVLSAIFGPLPLRIWGRIHGRHMEHHLRQYGV